MSNYRRAYQPGGCYFFTLVTHQRQPWLTQPANIERLRLAFRTVKAVRPFEMDALVIMPDHLHCLWRLPEGDSDFSERWRQIKRFVSIGVEAKTNARGEKLLWQRRFWEHVIRDQADWNKHMDYIHYNPVKHGYVNNPADWAHSSFNRALERGWYEANWGTQEPASIAGQNFE